MGYKISKCQQKQHLSVNFKHRTLISNQGPTKMKGSLIVLMTLIITITCDRARVDPGKARLEARDGSSVGRIDAGDARAAGRIDALDSSAVGRLDALIASAVGRIDAGDIDVISMKESRLDEEGRSPCGSSCPTGTICCLASRTCDSTCPDDRRSDEEGRTRCGKRCPTGTICCIASRTCDSTCSDDRRSDEEGRSPVGRETCSDGQIYCTHTST